MVAHIFGTKIIEILVRSWVGAICGKSFGEHLSDIYMWKSVQMTSIGNYLEDTCGKLSVGRTESARRYLQDVDGTLSARHLREPVRRTNVKIMLADILGKNDKNISEKLGG